MEIDKQADAHALLCLVKDFRAVIFGHGDNSNGGAMSNAACSLTTFWSFLSCSTLVASWDVVATRCCALRVRAAEFELAISQCLQRIPILCLCRRGCDLAYRNFDPEHTVVKKSQFTLFVVLWILDRCLVSVTMPRDLENWCTLCKKSAQRCTGKRREVVSWTDFSGY